MTTARGILATKRIALTRPDIGMNDDLGIALASAGARVSSFPVIAIAPGANLAATLALLGTYDWIAFTSANGVRALGPLPAGPHLAAVGRATARALAEGGNVPTVVAEREDGLGLAAALAVLGDLAGKRVLLPRGDRASGDLPAALRAAGALVEEVVAYRTVPDPVGVAALAEALDALDWLVVASGSAGEGVAAALKGKTRMPAIASLGPVTSAALRQLSLPVDAEAATRDGAALVAAIATSRTASR